MPQALLEFQSGPATSNPPQSFWLPSALIQSCHPLLVRRQRKGRSISNRF